MTNFSYHAPKVNKTVNNRGPNFPFATFAQQVGEALLWGVVNTVTNETVVPAIFFNASGAAASALFAKARA